MATGRTDQGGGADSPRDAGGARREGARAELYELLARREPLDPELAAHLEMTSIGLCIRHPLVYSMVHGEPLNALVNQALADKRAELERAATAGDWHSVVFLHERPWRSHALHRYRRRIPARRYWPLVADVWVDAENIRDLPELWQRLLHDPRPGRERMMRSSERSALAALPDVVELWQGHTDERDDGWSWSTDRSVAVWFAQRFAALEDATAMLTHARAARVDVTAYLLRRGENEIVIDPEKVEIVRTTTL